MPLGQGGALDGQVYADIVAYILAQSGVPGGTEKFTPTSPMERVLELDPLSAGRAAVSSRSVAGGNRIALRQARAAVDDKADAGGLDAADGAPPTG
jgi:hypothetical protein